MSSTTFKYFHFLFLVGTKIDRKSINYRLEGTSSFKIFKSFNALGTVAFSFGDAMLPEIQVVHLCFSAVSFLLLFIQCLIRIFHIQLHFLTSLTNLS